MRGIQRKHQDRYDKLLKHLNVVRIFKFVDSFEYKVNMVYSLQDKLRLHELEDNELKELIMDLLNVISVFIDHSEYDGELKIEKYISIAEKMLKKYKDKNRYLDFLTQLEQLNYYFKITGEVSDGVLFLHLLDTVNFMYTKHTVEQITEKGKVYFSSGITDNDVYFDSNAEKSVLVFAQLELLNNYVNMKKLKEGDREYFFYKDTKEYKIEMYSLKKCYEILSIIMDSDNIEAKNIFRLLGKYSKSTFDEQADAIKQLYEAEPWADKYFIQRSYMSFDVSTALIKMIVREKVEPITEPRRMEDFHTVTDPDDRWAISQDILSEEFDYWNNKYKDHYKLAKLINLQFPIPGDSMIAKYGDPYDKRLQALAGDDRKSTDMIKNYISLLTNKLGTGYIPAEKILERRQLLVPETGLLLKFNGPKGDGMTVLVKEIHKEEYHYMYLRISCDYVSDIEIILPLENVYSLSAFEIEGIMVHYALLVVATTLGLDEELLNTISYDALATIETLKEYSSTLNRYKGIFDTEETLIETLESFREYRKIIFDKFVESIDDLRIEIPYGWNYRDKYYGKQKENNNMGLSWGEEKEDRIVKVSTFTRRLAKGQKPSKDAKELAKKYKIDLEDDTRTIVKGHYKTIQVLKR